LKDNNKKNNNNNNNNNNLLINTLMYYVIENQSSLDRKGKTYNLKDDVCKAFFFTCRKLGLLSPRGRMNVALEGLMSDFIERYADRPSIVQTTLLPRRLKSTKPEINIAQKLELKLTKNELGSVLDALEQKRGHKDFLEGRLREVLPKAMRVYQNTRDKEIEVLLKKAEELV